MDSQAFDMQTHGGISRCFAELIPRVLQRTPHTDKKVLVQTKHKHKGRTLETVG